MREKSPASKGGTGGRAAKAPRRAAMSPAAAAGGPMTAAAVLTLQRAVGNQAVARMLARDEHVHGADRRHGTAQPRAAVETAEAPAEILNAAMASPSRPIDGGTLKKAQSFYQNDRLSLGRVHTGPLAQRAVTAFGAEAMTVGEHIFFGAGVGHDTATAFHEYGHLDKNTRGIAETGTADRSGIPVTDPDQYSEREAANDGAAAANGVQTAPSVVARQAVRQDNAAAVAASDTALQRATVQRMRRTRQSARSEEDDDTYGNTDYNRVDVNIVTDDTMQQNPSGRRAISQNTVMGHSARDVLSSAGRPPTGMTAHLHTAAAYAHGDGTEGQTQRATNLTPGSQATNLDHKRYEDSVASDAVPILGVVVTGAGLTGSGSSGLGHDVYDTMVYELRGPEGNRMVDSHRLDLHDYSSADERKTRPDYVPTEQIRSEIKYSAADAIMDMIPEDQWPEDYRQYRSQNH